MDWFCFISLYYWSRKHAPLSQPIRFKLKPISQSHFPALQVVCVFLLWVPISSSVFSSCVLISCCDYDSFGVGYLLKLVRKEVLFYFAWKHLLQLYTFIYIYKFFFKAHNDHFDLVSRRMGFIPLPLGSLVSSFRERGKERVRQGYSLFITDRLRASRSADPKVPVSRVNL